MFDPLTERQNEVFEYILRCRLDTGLAPSIPEICDHMGYASTNSAFKVLKALEKKGYIRRDGRARMIEVDEQFLPHDGGPRVPLVDPRRPIPAGEPIRSATVQYFAVDPFFFRTCRYPDNCIVVRAGDDGMSSAGIRLRDYVLVEEMDWKDCRQRSTIAVMMERRILVRRFEFMNQQIHLRTSERTYTDEMVAPDDERVRVIGPVRAVFRMIDL